MMSEKNQTLKFQAISGVLWSAIERFSVQGIHFVLSIIIARLVLPEEYGLIAMLSIFLAIAQTFVDSGFSNALIQKKNRSEVDFSTVFYFNIVIAIVVYVILYLSAPYIAVFYKESELVVVTRWVGLILIINSLSIVQRARLTINVDFKTQAKASLAAVIFSGLVGVALAYWGYGVWALVFQSLCNGILNTTLLWYFAKWRPKWSFSWNSFHTLFSFGSKLLLSGLMHTIYMNLYSLVIGRRYSAIDVGYYNRSNQFALFPSSNVVNIIARAVYPIQCRMQDDDERLSASFIQYLRITCFIVFPIMMTLAVLSEPLVRFFLTDKWLPSAELLAILSFAYMWCPVMMINNQMLNVRGRSDYFLKAEILKKMAALLILFFTLPFGVRVLCWGVVFYNFIDIVIIIFFVKKVISTGYWIQIKNLFPLFLISSVTGFITYLVSEMLIDQLFLRLLIGTLLSFAFYMILGLMFHVKEFSEVVVLVKSKLNK